MRRARRRMAAAGYGSEAVVVGMWRGQRERVDEAVQQQQRQQQELKRREAADAVGVGGGGGGGGGSGGVSELTVDGVGVRAETYEEYRRWWWAAARRARESAKESDAGHAAPRGRRQRCCGGVHDRGDDADAWARREGHAARVDVKATLMRRQRLQMHQLLQCCDERAWELEEMAERGSSRSSSGCGSGAEDRERDGSACRRGGADSWGEQQREQRGAVARGEGLRRR